MTTQKTPGDVSLAATIDSVVRERNELHKTLLRIEVKVEALIAQRDELLAALKAIINDGMHCDVAPIYQDKARAAIAKAEGGAAPPAQTPPPKQCAQCRKEYKQCSSGRCPKCATGLVVSETEFSQPIAPPPRLKESPTSGMNMAQRILHVGGRNNEAGYVEFGSVQAVEALVRHVLRDLPANPAQTPRREPLALPDIKKAEGGAA
jgi:hypothetical protein